MKAIGNTWGEFDADAYAQMEPDLLIDFVFDGALWYVPSKQQKKLEKLAPILAVNGQPTNVDEAIAEFVDLATELGVDVDCNDALADAKEDYEEAVAELGEAGDGLEILIASATEDTFYVDNLFVYVPMAQVKTLYYVDKVFYHYFIGREDQSVQEGVMIRRIDQQLRVNRLMLAQVDLDQVENKRLRRYLLNYLEIITTISTVLLFRAGDKEHLEKARAFWRDMARDYPRHYQLLSRRLFGRVLNMPGPGGRWPGPGREGRPGGCGRAVCAGRCSRWISPIQSCSSGRGWRRWRPSLCGGRWRRL